MPVCLGLPPAPPVVLRAEAFTLVWTHSVEQTEWREEWQVAGGRLRLAGAAVAGSGAGMEVPPGALLQQGAWRWRTQDLTVTRLRLARSGFAGDYRLCWSGVCRPLSWLLPGTGGPIEVYACLSGGG